MKYGKEWRKAPQDARGFCAVTATDFAVFNATKTPDVPPSDTQLTTDTVSTRPAPRDERDARATAACWTRVVGRVPYLEAGEVADVAADRTALRQVCANRLATSTGRMSKRLTEDGEMAEDTQRRALSLMAGRARDERRLQRCTAGSASFQKLCKQRSLATQGAEQRSVNSPTEDAGPSPFPARTSVAE